MHKEGFELTNLRGVGRARAGPDTENIAMTVTADMIVIVPERPVIFFRDGATTLSLVERNLERSLD